MKINSINSINYFSKAPAFKHTAVPYPEYENYYYQKKAQSFIDKVSELFQPSITKEASNIKSSIDTLYSTNSNKNVNPKAQLLSVLA